MIDGVAHRQFCQHLGIFRQVDRIEMQIDMPAERRDHRNDAVEGRHVGHPAEMAHEVEAAPAEPTFMQLAKAALGDGIVDIGDGAKGAVADRDGIQRHPVVGAMHAGIDDDGATDPELFVQRLEIPERRVGRRIGPSRRVRIFVTGAEDVGMRVTRQRRKLEFRRSRIGIGAWNGWLVHNAFCSGLVALHGVSISRSRIFFPLSGNALCGRLGGLRPA